MKSFLKIYSRVVLFLVPLFFLPVIYNSFEFGKVWFLLISGFVGLLIWLIGGLISREEVVKWNKFLVWFLVLVLWMVALFVMMDPGVRTRSMMLGVGFGTFVGLLVWLFLWLQIADKNEKIKEFGWLSISGIVLAIGSLVVFMIPAAKMPLVWPKSNPFFSINEGWTLAGSLLGEAILFLILVIEWMKRLLGKLKEKGDVNSYLVEALGVVFFGLILFLDIYRMTKIGWVYLDIKTAWIIAVEGLKTSPIFGVGVGNFYDAFLSLKPASFNLTKLWSSNFGASSVGLLGLWTETGLVGLALLVWGFVKLLRKIKEKNFWMVLLMVVVVLFLPLNFMSLFLLVWVMAFSGLFNIKESKMRLLVGEKNFNVMPYILGLLILIGVGFGGYWEMRMMIGDAYWLKAMKAASKNDGTATYNYEIKAIGMNQSMADYRVVYSQTCLSLVQNFLNKENISDEDKQNASTLVQQSVREAKSAINLDQKNSDYWSNLGSIYKSLTGMVEGAGDWAIQAYQQAIVLNPTSPLLKLDFGGLYYGLGDYESADRIFEEVVVSKNDYANGWYNWAYSAKKLNKLDLAVARLERALNFVPADSADYETASGLLKEWKKELEELTKKEAETQKEQGKEEDVNTLTVPETLPTGNESQIVLPTGNEMAPVTPEPTMGQ